MSKLIKKLLKEALLDKRIFCSNCGWSWKVKDGGDDLYVCHKCWHDNSDNYLQK